MPRPKSTVPALRVHKPTGQGYVFLDGHRVYLGRHDLPGTQRRYAETIAEWTANGGRLSVPQAELTIVELVARFLVHVGSYYRRPDGTPTWEPANYRQALRPLTEVYADTPAVKFGPLALKAVRERMIGLGWCRSSVNKQCTRVRGLFRWAAENELIPPAAYHALLAVKGLRRGRSGARETEPVRPVPDEVIEETIRHCTPTLATMIRLQQLTGMRPGEVCTMRTADIDTSGKVWTYTPERHKTEHFGRKRTIYLGPRAQEALKPWLRFDTQAYIFAPAVAAAECRERRHTERVTPKGQGNEPGDNVKRHPKQKPGDRYDVNGYRQAVNHACARAWPFPEPKGLRGRALISWQAEHRTERKQWMHDHRWNPHRLRHSFATHVRREHGLEAAQVLLGHAAADVTQVYAERDTATAIKVARKIG